MYPKIEDRRSTKGWGWRQVQLRVGPPVPYDFSGVTWRVVTWGVPYQDTTVFNVMKGRLNGADQFKLATLGLDLGPHEAFCRGDMPAAVYADWLEENVPDFPAAGLSLLRGLILNEVKA